MTEALWNAVDAYLVERMVTPDAVLDGALAASDAAGLSAINVAPNQGVVDNVLRHGAVIDAASADASVQGVRRLSDPIAFEPRVCATAIQTVGSKGHDGFAIELVLGDSP